MCVQVSFSSSDSSNQFLLFPKVTIPLDLTACRNHTHPTYSNDTLVSPCQVTQLIAMSAYPPTSIRALQCSSSPPPNCSDITCSVPGSRDSLRFRVQPCYSPPAISVTSTVNGTTSHNTFPNSHGSKFSFRVPMNVTLVQHTNYLSMGFKVLGV